MILNSLFSCRNLQHTSTHTSPFYTNKIYLVKFFFLSKTFNLYSKLYVNTKWCRNGRWVPQRISDSLQKLGNGLMWCHNASSLYYRFKLLYLVFVFRSALPLSLLQMFSLLFVLLCFVLALSIVLMMPWCHDATGDVYKLLSFNSFAFIHRIYTFQPNQVFAG